MEWRFSEFGELVIEELHESVDVLRSVLRVGDSLSTVRVTDLDGRIKEDQIRFVIPGVLIELRRFSQYLNDGECCDEVRD